MTETTPPDDAALEAAIDEAMARTNLARTGAAFAKATEALAAARTDLYQAIGAGKAAGLSIRAMATEAGGISVGMVQDAIKAADGDPVAAYRAERA